MTIPKPAATQLCVACLVMLVAAGCGRSPTEKAKSDAVIWKPDPELAKQLTQTGEVGDYQLSVPQEFTAVKAPVQLPPGIKSATWVGKAKPGELPALLTVVVMSEEKAVKEAKENLRHYLVDFTEGVASTSRMSISAKEQTENGVLGGIPFSRFKWSGTRDGTSVRGLVYGTVNNGQAIAIIGMNFGPNADTANKLLESAVATFAKR